MKIILDKGTIIAYSFSMKKTNFASIARKHNTSRSFVCDIKKGRRKTSQYLLAIDIAAATHKPPITYISDNLKKTYVTVWPELMDKL